MESIEKEVQNQIDEILKKNNCQLTVQHVVGIQRIEETQITQDIIEEQKV